MGVSDNGCGRVAQVRGDGPTEEAKLLASAIAAPITAFGDFDRWRHPLLLFPTRIRIAGRNLLFCTPKSDDLHHVVRSGQGAVHDALMRHLLPGGEFVDAGANIGAFTVLGIGRSAARELAEAAEFDLQPWAATT